ncbi:MAG: J domain-containing protein [Egibacteraceae bacterium]
MSPDRARRLLAVPPDAARDEIERAFRRLARVHHPDRGGDAGRFAELVAAREVLLRPRAASEAQLIVIHTRPWRRVVRAVQRWRFRARLPRPGVRVR